MVWQGEELKLLLLPALESLQLKPCMASPLALEGREDYERADFAYIAENKCWLQI